MLYLRQQGWSDEYESIRQLGFLGFISSFQQSIRSTRAELITAGSSVPSRESGTKCDCVLQTHKHVVLIPQWLWLVWTGQFRLCLQGLGLASGF